MPNLTILHVFSLSMLFTVYVLFCYPCCVTLIEIGGDALVSGFPFMQGIICTIFWELAEISPSFLVPSEIGMCIFTLEHFWPKFRPAFGQLWNFVSFRFVYFNCCWGIGRNFAQLSLPSTLHTIPFGILSRLAEISPNFGHFST